MYYVKTAANAWDTYLYVDGTAVGGANALQFNNAGALTVPAPPSTIAYPAYNPGNGAAPITLSLGYGQTTQFGSGFGVNFLTQDGYTTGRLAGVEIDDLGVMRARYTNGQSLVQGQVVLSNFTNPQGLKPAGDTAWNETSLSGVPLTGAPGTASLGLIQSGALEDSNVDLTKELVQMITSQRSFQANAQMISTADSITQTIINIR
jgi:flagellar hook protein FlgE